MRHIAFRIFVILICIIFVILYVFPWKNYGIEMPFSGGDYRLGLDLQWWIELDYKVDFTELKQEKDFDKTKEKEILEWLKSIIAKRVEVLKINDSEINDASYSWESHIIVQIPLKWNNFMENLENIQIAKEAIWKVVKIQFKERRTEITQDDKQERRQIAMDALEELKSGEWFIVVWNKYSLNYEKVAVWEIDSLDSLVSTWSIVPWELNEIEITWWETWFLLVNDDNTSYIYISWTPSEWKPAMDSKWRILDDKYFVRSSVQHNQAYQPMVELTFNNEWAKIFAELTQRLVGQKIAIFVWWEMLTAPDVNEVIPWWKAVITWQYTSKEAKELSQNINTWVVPAPIYLTSEKTIDSKIWADSLWKLVVAWIAGFFLIFIFLIVIYRIWGLMASISLLIYAILILAIAKVCWVVLTIAAIAWVILSIWMAIDANILIFERIIEKLKDWETILDATDAWFKESWSAIWDSNFTWIITAIILFVFWINMIKGFGLMLAIWLILSLLVIIFVSRVLLLFLALKLKDKKLFVGYKK